MSLDLQAEQAAFARLCFSFEPSEEDLKALGALRDRWLLYRDMVRSRLRRMLNAGIPRTVAALGEAEYGAWFDRWLAERPPGTRYIREIVPEFVAFALPRWGQPAWVDDLLRFETARWEVGYLDAPAPSVTDFAFENAPVPNPALRRLRLRHRVHEAKKPGPNGYEKVATCLCVFRRPSTDRIATWVLTERAMDWMDAFCDGEGPTTARIQKVAAARGETIDPTYVEALGATVADFLENELLLGSAP